jgi:hypothetical protein
MMHQTLRVAVLVMISTALLPTWAVYAEDVFKMLDGKEIRARIVGKEITDASHWSMYLRPDGALIGTESSTRWTGTWKIEKNKLCMSNPSNRLLDCYDVWISGEKVSLRLNKGDGDFVAVIEKHKGN